MSNPYFEFRQFTVYQDQCAMKVGTDGVLLGAWTDSEGARRILDVGTGTGLIALMLAQRTEAAIDAVEIDEKAARQAMQNVEASPWPDRIHIHCIDFQGFSAGIHAQYDLIVSNPPYHQQSLKPPDQQRSYARHDTSLGYDELLRHTARFLAPHGRFSVILPSDKVDVMKDKAWLNGLYLKRLTKVRTTDTSPPARALIEFSRTRQHAPEISLLTLMESGSRTYTTEYKKLTSAYYL